MTAGLKSEVYAAIDEDRASAEGEFRMYIDECETRAQSEPRCTRCRFKVEMVINGLCWDCYYARDDDRSALDLAECGEEYWEEELR